MRKFVSSEKKSDMLEDFHASTRRTPMHPDFGDCKGMLTITSYFMTTFRTKRAHAQKWNVVWSLAFYRNASSVVGHTKQIPTEMWYGVGKIWRDFHPSLPPHTHSFYSHSQKGRGGGGRHANIYFFTRFVLWYKHPWCSYVIPKHFSQLTHTNDDLGAENARHWGTPMKINFFSLHWAFYSTADTRKSYSAPIPSAR